MCRMCTWTKYIYTNSSHFLVLSLCLIYLLSGVRSQINVNLFNRIQNARHNNCSTCKRILDLSIAEKRRLDIIMKQIIDKLEIEPRSKQKQEASVKPRDSPIVQQKQTYPEISEIVSFPEKSDNASSKNVLMFTINAQSTHEPLEAMKANLWILVRQRKQAHNRGKKIWLNVSQIDDDNKTQHYLTSIRTRVKKTRWQKIGLPVTLIQSMLDDDQHTLKLKVTCKKCGKVIRPVLRRKQNHRKRRHNGRKNKQKNAKKSARMQNKSLKNTDSIQPFLVISTRYKHRLSR